jgi:hypothetical protein
LGALRARARLAKTKKLFYLAGNNDNKNGNNKNNGKDKNNVVKYLQLGQKR